MNQDIQKNGGDYLTLWVFRDCTSYKLSGIELHQLVLAACNDTVVEYPPGVSEEKKKEM